MRIDLLSILSRGRSFLWVIVLVCLAPIVQNPIVLSQGSVPNYRVTHIAASGDGTRLAVLGRTGQNSSGQTVYFVDILDSATLQVLSSVDIGANYPAMLDLSSDGSWFVYNVPYTELRTINIVTGESAVLYGGGPSEVGALDWSPADGRLAYAVGAGVSIAQFYGELPASQLIDEETPGLINAVAWSTNGHDLATTTYAPPNDYSSVGIANIQIWREAQITSSPIVNVPSTRFSGGGSRIMVWNPTDEFIASGYRDGVALFDVDTGQPSFLLSPSGEPSDSIAWSPDGTQIAAGSLNVIWVWDVASGQVVNTITVNGLVDALIWLPTVGLIHNGRENGLYQNGNLVTDPIVATPSPTPTDIPTQKVR